MQSKTRYLVLNRDEVMVLADRTRDIDYGTDEQRVQCYELLRKLACLYIELVTLDGVIKENGINVTEAETWLLRSKVQSSEKTATNQLFGVKLLRKLYEIIISFDTTLDILVSEEDEPAINDDDKAVINSYWKTVALKEKAEGGNNATE